MGSGKILLCVNSDIGRSNTIGFRFGKIAIELIRQGIPVDIIARANYTSSLKVRQPWLGNKLARVLNAIRIYIFPKFDSRRSDVYFFERFVLRALQKTGAKYSVAHLGEFMPTVTRYLKNQGARVLLDMPIGHDSYSVALKRQGITVGVDVRPAPAYLDAALAAADEVIVPSEFVASTLVSVGLGAVPMKRIPFGVARPTNFTVTDIISRLKQKPMIFLFAGNANYRKGLGYLLEAWRRANLTDAKLIICGRVYKEIQGDIKKYQSATIQFTGFVSNINDYLKSAHAFVFPTLLEGSAKIVYEAMSYGLPVITTANAGSLIEDNVDGYIIPLADPVTLADKLRFLYEHKDVVAVLGARAFAKVQAYTWERYAKAVIAEYQIN
ncbi:MAG: glycosyltransferase family 4 protein [Candidatus Magasanikbacteria bacterium]|nr:glycosyltransferase family 4 protein [Candidatus Magasanikbacteria bacterium]